MTRILIVENVKAHREVLTEYLEERGYEVVTSSSLPDAVKVCKHRVFDAYVVCLEIQESNAWANSLLRDSQNPVIQYVTYLFGPLETNCHQIFKGSIEELLDALPQL